MKQRGSKRGPWSCGPRMRRSTRT